MGLLYVLWSEARSYQGFLTPLPVIPGFYSTDLGLSHRIAALQNIPSWKGPTRIVEPNSWLHAEQPEQ